MLPASEWLGPLPQWNWWPGPREIDGSVQHTMVGTIASATSRFRNPDAEVSATFGIGLSGRIVMWVRPLDIAYHAGNWPINVSRLGFENEDDGAYWDAERTPELYLASGALLAACAAEWNFALDDEHNGPHNRYSATACPDALDVRRILAIAQGEVMYVDIETFKKYTDDVANAFTAVKELLNPIAAWVFDAPRRPATEGRRQKAMRMIEIAAKPPRIPRRLLKPRKRPKNSPTRAKVLAGHGRG